MECPDDTTKMITKQKTELVLLQYASTFIASITTLGLGCMSAWPSPALTYLRSKQSYIPTTEDEGSWIASLPLLGLIIGYLINPVLIDKTGRKKTLMIFGVSQFISWLLITLATSIIVLYTARIIQGIGYGGGICSSTIYISEIGDRKSRGIFIVIMKCSISIGALITMILGASLSYQNMHLVLLMMPLLFVVLFPFMPDSLYFVEINQRNENEEVMSKSNILRDEEERTELKLQKLGEFETSDLQITSLEKSDFETKDDNFKRSNSETKNFRTNNCETSSLMENSIKTDIPKKKTNNTRANNTSYLKIRTLNLKETNYWKLFSLPNYRKALAIIVSLIFVHVFSGQMALTAFTEQIFTYDGSFLKPKIAAIVVKSAGAVISIMFALIIERINRRSLLLSSGMTIAISTGLVGMFFFIKENKLDFSFIKWLPLFGLTLSDAAFHSGVGSLFYIYQGEILAVEIKSEGITIIKILYMILNFLLVLKFQALRASLGTSVTFFIFAVGSALSTYITYIITPETRGKSNQEIQILLKPFSGNVMI